MTTPPAEEAPRKTIREAAREYISPHSNHILISEDAFEAGARFVLDQLTSESLIKVVERSAWPNIAEGDRSVRELLIAGRILRAIRKAIEG